MSLRALAAARAGTSANAASGLGFRSSFAMAHQIKGLSRPLSSEASTIKELPGDEANDVIFENKFGLRVVTLNRPKKLNSLNGSMIRKIIPRLVEWEKSHMANIIIMKGAGEKSLCAGGDVAALAKYNQEGPDGWKKSADYFALEYKLDHYIATYKKPYVAFMDGITMGGGVGLSIHAPLRIATERTVFAMPETTIGFFPDVGASFFLPRMNGSVGTYLALTSERLTGANVLYAGIATHYLHSSSLPDLEARLGELRFSDSDSFQKRLSVINETVDEFSTGLPYEQTMQIGGEVRRAIDRCFNKNNVDDIIAALKKETGETEAWAKRTLDTLQKRSPTAVHVALRQMRVGGKWNIAEAFEKEHQIASKFMQHADFTEGVTALLVRKEKPKWQPESLEAIPASDNVAKPFFEFDKTQSLGLFTDRTYSDYPYEALGVPSEKEVEAAVANNSYTPDELTKAVVASRKGRQGVSDIIKDIVSRKTTVDEQGKVQWVKDEPATTSRL